MRFQDLNVSNPAATMLLALLRYFQQSVFALTLHWGVFFGFACFVFVNVFIELLDLSAGISQPTATTSMPHLFYLLLLLLNFVAPELFQSTTSHRLKAAPDNLISSACFDEY